MTSYPLTFREAYMNNFTIPTCYKELTTYYKMSKWSASYFLAQWEKNAGTYAAGTIHKYNEINHVQFCKSCSVGKIKSLVSKYPNLQLVLSFRKAPGLPAYVIVDFVSADKDLFSPDSHIPENIYFPSGNMLSNMDELEF